MQKNRDFRLISRFISEMIQDWAIVTMERTPIWTRMRSIEWCCFQWPWVTSNPDVNVTPLFDAEYIRSGIRDIDVVTMVGIPIWSYTRPTQRCRFEWLWVTLNDSDIFGDTKHLCDIASCVAGSSDLSYMLFPTILALKTQSVDSK